MTLGESLSTIRGNIKEITDDSKYPDSILYTHWKQHRGQILSEQAKKFNHISAWNTHAFCVKLEKDTYHDCSCIKAGCQVLKTKFKIPNAVIGRNRALLKVTDLDGTLIPFRTATQIKSDKHDPIKCDKRGYDIQNQTIVIWNDLNMPTVRLEGVWADLLGFQTGS